MAPILMERSFLAVQQNYLSIWQWANRLLQAVLGQIGDVLEHKKTAYLVEPGNVENLAEAMNTLIMEPGLCNVLGQNARAEVLSKYTWEKHLIMQRPVLQKTQL